MNFEQLFIPQPWLRSASNFAQTHFRQFPTLHVLPSKKQIKMFLDLKTMLYMVFSRFLRSYGKMDLEIRFGKRIGKPRKCQQRTFPVPGHISLCTKNLNKSKFHTKMHSFRFTSILLERCQHTFQLFEFNSNGIGSGTGICPALVLVLVWVLVLFSMM